VAAASFFREKTMEQAFLCKGLGKYF
jgi:hypothetical protein